MNCSATKDRKILGILFRSQSYLSIKIRSDSSYQSFHSIDQASDRFNMCDARRLRRGQHGFHRCCPRHKTLAEGFRVPCVRESSINEESPASGASPPTPL